MATLYEILENAQDGEAMSRIGRGFELTPEQTQAAVASLLPAISLGLKRSTETPEGLGALFSLMGQQPDLFAMYNDPDAAFSPEGQLAGEVALANMFGSPEATGAIADQAQQLSGVTSGILKKLLPVLAGILISGLMRSGSGQAAPQAPQAPSAPPPQSAGGGLFDILREIFQQGASGAGGADYTGPGSSPVPPIGDIIESSRRKAALPLEPTSEPSGQAFPLPAPDTQAPGPTNTGGQAGTGGDLLSQIMRDLEKALREGRLKPVVIGPYEVDVSGGGASPRSGQPQAPGGDILGKILREALGGALSQGQGPKTAPPAALMGGAGTAVFGDSLEPGHDVEQTQLESLQKIVDRYLGVPRR